ncbi:hypothetical protein ACQY0O_005025 [Thecaphora frezii]
MSSFTTLPIVSLTDPRLGDSILHACTQTGFFYLSDHGIPTDHIDGIFDLARAFFALHQVEKRRYADRESNTGSVTLLFQKDVGGLQVEQRQGEWIDVEPKAGCLVVNVADAIEFWTAGMFRSTLHRVVLPRSEAEAVSRYSMAYFCQPDEHCVLQPLSISHDLRRQVGDKAMSREEIEARLKRKGIDLDKKKEGGGGGEGEGPEGYLERVRMTGGEYLRRRLRATYR